VDRAVTENSANDETHVAITRFDGPRNVSMNAFAFASSEAPPLKRKAK